jgi:hypothetical protein
MDLAQRYRQLEAELNYLTAKKDLWHDAERLLKKELARTEDQIAELTKELLQVIKELTKS